MGFRNPCSAKTRRGKGKGKGFGQAKGPPKRSAETFLAAQATERIFIICVARVAVSHAQARADGLGRTQTNHIRKDQGSTRVCSS